MTKDELKKYLDSTKEKLQLLEKKAFEEKKEKYPIIKLEIETYQGDVEFIEDNLGRDLDENTIETFKTLLDQINETADLDLEDFVKETGLDTPLGEAIVAMKRAAMDNEQVLKEDQNVEVNIPPVEDIIAKAEETPTEEVANDLDQVNTEEIINSLEPAPAEEAEPIPQDLVDEMLAADAPAEEAQEVQNVPTQDINIEALDSILDTLTPPEELFKDEPVQEGPVPVAAAAGTTPVQPESPSEPGQVYTTETNDGQTIEYTVSQDGTAAAGMTVDAGAAVEQPVAVEAPVAPEVNVQPGFDATPAPAPEVIVQPGFDATPAPTPEVIVQPGFDPTPAPTPEVIVQPGFNDAPAVPTLDAFNQQPVMETPQVDGPVLAKTL